MDLEKEIGRKYSLLKYGDMSEYHIIRYTFTKERGARPPSLIHPKTDEVACELTTLTAASLCLFISRTLREPVGCVVVSMVVAALRVYSALDVHAYIRYQNIHKRPAKLAEQCHPTLSQPLAALRAKTKNTIPGCTEVEMCALSSRLLWTSLYYYSS